MKVKIPKLNFQAATYLFDIYFTLTMFFLRNEDISANEMYYFGLNEWCKTGPSQEAAFMF
jgi:hypothetical protein